MDSAKTKLSKKFHNIIHFNKSSTKKPAKNLSFCLLIPQQNHRCCESHQFHKDDEENEESCKRNSRNRAAMEAFIAKLFATISSFKAAYAELQMAQFPYNDEALEIADQNVVNELKSLSELKHKFLRRQIDLSPPHVTLMLSEIQEQQSLMKTYEITMKKMQNEIERKEAQISSLQKELRDCVQNNKAIELEINASGSYSVLDSVLFSEANVKDFVMVLNYALRSIRNFVKLLIREMESANWDVDSAVKSIQPDVKFLKKDHKAFAFESFVCREIFGGFSDAGFNIKHDFNGGHYHFFFEEFKNLKSVNLTQLLKSNPNSLFGKFLKSKYLLMVHPKMEFSFAGNLNQRKLVNYGEFPETEFFKVFAEMGRRVWILHCLAFSFDQEVGIFQVNKGCRFSEVYMQSVTNEFFTAVGGGVTAAFTVVPGFNFGKTVVQCQVYPSPSTSASKQIP